MRLLKELSLLLSDYWVSYFYFIYKHGYIPRFKEPRSLSEKINYIKLYNRNPLRAKITDRLWVRDYVRRKSSSCRLVEVLWHGVDFSEHVWNELPNKFVLKANHGSQMVLIVDKSKDVYDEVFEVALSWLERDYTKYGREWVYLDLKKYLIVEEFLEFNGGVPPDYKYFCFNGKVEFVQVDFDRFSHHRRNIHDREFRCLDFTIVYPSGAKGDMPPQYHKGIEIAEDLAMEFDFIRVDLYLLDEHVYFGELTNTPEGGSGRVRPREQDFKLGKKLPSKILR